MLSLLLTGCAADFLQIDGTVEDFSDTVMVEAIPWAVWTGEAESTEATEYHSAEAAGDFSFSVGPGEWAVVGTRGTCSAVESVEGEAGDVLSVALVLSCVE